MYQHNYVSPEPHKIFGCIIRRINGKAIPLQAWTGPEGSRKLMLPDFKTIGT